MLLSNKSPRISFLLLGPATDKVTLAPQGLMWELVGPGDCASKGVWPQDIGSVAGRGNYWKREPTK